MQLNAAFILFAQHEFALHMWPVDLIFQPVTVTMKKPQQKPMFDFHDAALVRHSDRKPLLIAADMHKKICRMQIHPE